MNLNYFNALGYKCADLSQADWIIKDFQSHCKLTPDGIIGAKTKAAMTKYNKNNFCPEVFEPIKPYVEYSDEQIESLCTKGLATLGNTFNYYSQLNDFDVLHNLAHAILESASGTSKIAVDKNNLYGWAAYDNSAYDSAYGFVSKGDCIKAWSEWFNRVYLLPTGNQFRGNSEYAVNVVYASSSIAGVNKSFLVQQLRNRLKSTQTYLPNDDVPGAPDFVFKEGYSNTQINGIRKIKVDPIPMHLMDNAIRVFQNLQLIRNYFKVAVIISSSGNLYRNADYNKAIGGATSSQHLLALAADVYVTGIPSRLVYEWAKDNTQFKGFGIINTNWIHLDLRDTFWYEEY
jgi:beta-N-acetylglucosaminidase